MKEVVSDVYRIDPGYELKDISKLTDTYKVIHWKPGLFNFVPPGYSFKYILYWLFHYFGIFKNKYYSAVLVYDSGKLISKMIVTPAYFKFPFMFSNEIQFTYSVTNPEYRGKGINTMVKFYIMNQISVSNMYVCGVVDPNNKSNIKVYHKMGMSYRFKVRRKYYSYFPISYKVIKVSSDD